MGHGAFVHARKACNFLTRFAGLQGEPCGEDYEGGPEGVGGEQVGYLYPQRR
jgi:hypothetical protein